MSGKPKQGLDFSGWSVNIFDGDNKIDKLLDACGWKGFGVYFFLCQRAYGANGYYYEWGYDDCATTARKMGGGVTSSTVREAVNLCLQVGLFHQGLFDRWGILTSAGIQRRFSVAAGKRRVVSVNSNFWLPESGECPGSKKDTQKSDLSPTNDDLSPTNDDLLPTNAIKERKVKESKGKDIRADIVLAHESTPEQNKKPSVEYSEITPIILKGGEEWRPDENNIIRWSELYPEIDIKHELKKMSLWCEGHVSQRKTKKEILKFVTSWLAKALDTPTNSKNSPEEKKEEREKYDENDTVGNWKKRQEGGWLVDDDGYWIRRE